MLAFISEDVRQGARRRLQPVKVGRKRLIIHGPVTGVFNNTLLKRCYVHVFLAVRKDEALQISLGLNAHNY